MTRTIIIDDEQHCIDRLKKLLEASDVYDILLEGYAKTPEDGIELINAVKPDLVFLDINLGEQTGFDLLRSLKSIDFSIIFCTAYDKYAVEAFRFSALDYLLKPVSADLLKDALEKYSINKNKADLEKKIELLLHNNRSQHKRIAIPDMKGIAFIPLDDIVRCQGNVNYTTVYLRSGEQLLASKTIKEFEEMLKGYHFFRIHNSHIVNLGCIKRYVKGSGGSVVLEDGTELDVSVRRKEDFLSKMKA